MPNYLVQTLMPALSDTELRVLLVLLRLTVGWNKPGATVTVPYRRLMEMTGRSSETVWKAVQGLTDKRLVHTAPGRRPRKLGNSVSESDRQQYKDNT